MKTGRIVMKNKSRWVILVLGIVLASFGPGLAVDSRQVPPKNLTKPAPSPVPFNRADLQVSWIKAWPCACLEPAAAADTMILKAPIVVHVTNSGPKAADARVLVTFQDLKKYDPVQASKDIHLNAGQHLDVAFIEDTSPARMVLLRKSIGIEAMISLTTAGISDTDSSNNVKKITACTSVVD
jgi:hypothetical protein